MRQSGNELCPATQAQKRPLAMGEEDIGAVLLSEARFVQSQWTQSDRERRCKQMQTMGGRALIIFSCLLLSCA